MPPVRFNVAIKVGEDTPLLVALQAAAKLSKSELKRALSAGAVWLRKDGSKKVRRIRRASQHVGAGDLVTLYYDYHLLRQKSDHPRSLFQNKTFSIWYKPPGMLSQGTKYGDHLSLLRRASQTLATKKELFLVHRLDREARGMVVLAHSKQSCSALSKQFKDHGVVKRYWAQVQGNLCLSQGPFEIDRELDGKACRTVIVGGRYLDEQKSTELLLELKTGRFHQIRRHLAGLGHPLVGDVRYGSAKKYESLHLCAYELCFQEPSGSRKQLCCTLPSTLLPAFVMEHDNRCTPGSVLCRSQMK